MKKPTTARIDFINAIRGFAVILMIVHHFMYDLVTFLDAPSWLYSNGILDIFQRFFAGVFICLCGVSSRFSHSNIKRGIATLCAAGIISAVTFFIEMPIIFGVLHLLGTCMLFYGLSKKLWDVIPRWLTLIISVAGTIITAWCITNVHIENKNLWILGWTYNGFVSHDYFPLFPWIFVFLFGTWLGFYIRDNRFPRWFYTTKIPILPTIGRHSLLIYIAHQPVLYGVTVLLKLIFFNT